MREKYLPIGTVVMLKGGQKRLMISGFCSKAEGEDSNKIFDYSGCIYPEGFLRTDQVCLFNHDQIDTIFHMGFVDQEETEFKKNLNTLIAQQNNKEKI